MGPGPDEMNLETVSRVAAGVAAFLGSGSVVIGYDGRRDSDTFARQITEVMAGRGLHVHLLPRALPTPVLAASIRSLRCDAGLMVTASHNPADDNGVKVYLADGIQIIPPVDRQIADAITSVESVDLTPASAALAAPSWSIVPESVIESYRHRVAALCEPGPRHLRIAHTALHGVGGETFAQVMALAGFSDVIPVRAQAHPDPTFPTAPFPNPEIPGVLDLLCAQMLKSEADLGIAHDPDADRCAAVVRTSDGELRPLSGDELGAFLCWWILQRVQRGTWRSGTFASSVVSSTLLGRMAESAGMRSARTLTGFKWIARVEDLTYGYEEALGYCVAPHIVGDKDGISAGLILAEACAHLKTQGQTPVDVLDDLSVRYGCYRTGQRTIRSNAEAIHAAMTHLRTAPPQALAGRPVTQVVDYIDSSSGLPPTDLIEISAGGVRAMVRPSGTEPLIKIYGEAVVDDGTPVKEQRMWAEQELTSALDDLVSALSAQMHRGHS
jgi:phosphomannomutase